MKLIIILLALFLIFLTPIIIILDRKFIIKLKKESKLKHFWENHIMKKIDQ
jgi:hypothetical protein